MVVSKSCESISPENLFKMSQLIRSRKTVMIAPCLIPPPPTLATTAPTEMNPKSVNLVGPWVSQVPGSLASSVVLPVSTRRGHRRPCTPDTTSTSITYALATR
ncbi:hypothetical protein DVH24_015646 [Malus domestica]|uniref:Uncharacterized protein n=1 Tax=Malus domestica TaxID=3750 RepID=A0A498HL48_MALDO|nr:hypothetical protein DVH24_015646 [Malus domestica]